MADLFNIDTNLIKHNGDEVILMKLNGDVVYERTTKDRGFLIEYTVGDYNRQLNKGNLPVTEPVIDYSIEIILSDGQTTNDTSTLCYKIDKVIIPYSEMISSLKFGASGTFCVIETLEYCKTDNFVDMSYMFYDCTNLTKINTSNWNTSKVTDMSRMFTDCHDLTKLNLKSFDTSNVTNMYDMFNGCESLTSLNLSNFNTSKVTNMQDIFHNCKLLTSLDVSTWDTGNVTRMDGAFWNCTSLTDLDLSSWDLSKLDTFSGLMNTFTGCGSLTNLQAPRNINSYVNFDDSPLLTHDSLMSIINNLSTISGKTLTLGETNLAKLSEEEKAIVTNKGWALK